MITTADGGRGQAEVRQRSHDKIATARLHTLQTERKVAGLLDNPAVFLNKLHRILSHQQQLMQLFPLLFLVPALDVADNPERRPTFVVQELRVRAGID